MKKNMSFLVFAVALLVILFFISSSREVPFIPPDGLHAKVTTNGACAECHAPGKRAPLKENHPPKEQCFICHKTKKMMQS